MSKKYFPNWQRKIIENTGKLSNRQLFDTVIILAENQELHAAGKSLWKYRYMVEALEKRLEGFFETILSTPTKVTVLLDTYSSLGFVGRWHTMKKFHSSRLWFSYETHELTITAQCGAGGIVVKDARPLVIQAMEEDMIEQELKAGDERHYPYDLADMTLEIYSVFHADYQSLDICGRCEARITLERQKIVRPTIKAIWGRR